MPQPYNYSLNTPPSKFGENFAAAQIAAKKQRDDAAALAAQQQMQTDLTELSRNPSVSVINNVMAKYPMIADKFKPLLESVNDQKKKSMIGQASDVYMALGHGKREIAMEILQSHADAARNSGDEQEAKSSELQKKLIESADTGTAGDDAVLQQAGMFLSAAMGPAEFAKVYGGLLQERRSDKKLPAELSKAESDAAKSATAAKYAESEAVMDLQKSGWDITKIQNDIEISKLNAQIAAATVSATKTGNSLKLQELQDKRDEKVREKAYEGESALSTIDQSTDIIDELFKDEDTLKVAIGAGSFRASVPGSKAKSVAGKIEQLQNTIASANLDKLKGAMSDKDIVFLKNIATSLNRNQNEAAFLKELRRIEKTLKDSRVRVAAKYGVPNERTVLVD